jgi:DNA-binding NtrC family response regulator/tetratricopeptide (TPR) repeat protein
MFELLADRFLPSGAAWIDLATGAAVRVRLTPIGSRTGSLVWNDWCAALAVMRHPVLNCLVDYGLADATRRFEAYSVSPPVAAGGAAGSRLLMHAARFLEAHGVHVSREVAPLALREVSADASPYRRRPLGVVLQPRRALQALEEALGDVAPGGVEAITVIGGPGSGLRTLRVQIARAARLQGYVPVAADLIARLPRVGDPFRDRHVCVLLDTDSSRSAEVAAAALSARLGRRSTRRHVLIRFGRARVPATAHLSLDPLGAAAMTSIVFTQPDFGPHAAEVIDAVRLAEGNPGRLLSYLRASPFPEPRVTYSIAHETAPAYVATPGPRPAAARSARPRSVVSASERAARLAARGRHASAIRLLTRAARVLELRCDRALAARCAEQLGWILRERGRTGAALEQFTRSGTLLADGTHQARTAIAAGVAWTDQCRFAEAEASLRSAMAAAEVLKDTDLDRRARLGLARCLYWAGRFAEAAVILEPALQTSGESCRAIGLALSSRISSARGDLPSAARLAREALAAAETEGPRPLAAAARAMAEAQAALGDDLAARAYIRQGLAAATAAHAPLPGLRLRALALEIASRGHPGGGKARERLCAFRRNSSLPPLFRYRLERDVSRESATATSEGLPSAAVAQLQELLELAFSAADDAAGIVAVCQTVCERLRAATVQVIAAGPDRQLLARAGRPWAGDLRVVERALAGPGTGSTLATDHPREAAEAIRQAGRPIAVLACRWTATAPVDPREALALLRTAALALSASVRALLDRPAAAADPVWCDLIGVSAAALELRDAITRAARAPFPVLIEGESGSGKELVARAIHRLGSRRERRLCTVNCAALSEELLEAELFGHARGAFTGAVGERAGLFEEADGGTLFLDEVGELSPRAQAKLLRVLQDGEVRRVGENFARRVDARVIAATNRRLEDEVAAGRFRADLRFRLDVVRIAVPPLRERPLDIPLLAAHFWEEAAGRVGSRASLTAETVQALARCDWPGNIRQLQNVIASLAVHAPRRGRISPSLLPAQIARSADVVATSFETAREEFERRFVAAELARAGGQRARAARALGVTRQGLAKMMRRLRIE